MHVSEFKQMTKRIEQLDLQANELNNRERQIYAEQTTLQNRYGYNLPIEHLNLSTTIFNRLSNAGYTTIDKIVLEIVSAAPGTIPIPGFGKKSWNDLLQRLAEARYMPETRQILEESLQRLHTLDRQAKRINSQRTAVQQERAYLASLTGYNVPLEQLGLTARTYSPLHTVGYRTAGEIVRSLIETGPHTIMQISRFGSKSWHDLLRCLENEGYIPEDLQPILDESAAKPSQRHDQ